MGKTDWTDTDEQKYLLKQYNIQRYQLVCQQFCRKGLKRQTLNDGRIRIYTCCYQKIAATQADIPATIKYLATLVKEQVEQGRLSCSRPLPNKSP